MSDLIKRIEAAEGPSKEIDRRIAKSRGWHRVEPRFLRNNRGGWIAPEDFIGVMSDGSPILDSMHGTTIHGEVPAFTSSIDAAMTLVPDGAIWTIEADAAWVRVPRAGGVDEFQAHFLTSGGRLTALALCAAAMKAKEAKQ